MLEFLPGDRVRLPSGREGVVRAAPWHMPGFTFVEFPGGLRQWLLTSLLERLEEAV
ncbi:MAG: hypothetical protein QNJ46_24315 [Leptolyngbyaceae cyanobacterium MO_188.B28]|nr:hypothetical protein [Leptolyngbyaceae cyanobacterium MO_188.B28]